MPTFYNVTSTGGDPRALQVPTAAGRAVTSGVPEVNCEFTSKRQLMVLLNAKMYAGLDPGEVQMLVARLNSTDLSGLADPTYFIPSSQVIGSGATGSPGAPLAGTTIAVGDK